MKNIFKIISFLFLMQLQFGFAQNVTVTVQVLPPYSTYLPDYLNNPSKIYITLLSNEDATIKLKANITGDNGISLNTTNTSTATPIQLLANQIKLLNGTDLKKCLDINNVTVSGINKNNLYQGSGIPEGVYTICIQALDFETNAVLSESEPIGCSLPFEIQQINPPQLLFPPCNETIDASSPQNVVFSWLMAPGAPVTTKYKLKIVELIPSTRNPNEAMNSATTPAFFETITNTYSFLYGPAQPKLKEGMRYAWRVTALSSIASATPSAAGSSNSNFQNNGNSEVCSFEYKKGEMILPVASTSSTIKLVYPIQKQKINNGVGFEFSWKASTNPQVKEYQVQMTDQVSDKEKIKNWSQISDLLFKYQYSYGTIDSGLNLKATMNASYAASNGKNAWRVVGLDENKTVIDVSPIETYEIVELSSTDRIQLISPIQRKKIPNGYGIKLEWQSSKKQTVASYQIQFTDRLSQDNVITDWNQVTDQLFAGDYPYCVTTDKTQELFFTIPNQMTSGTGKFAWRVIAKDVNGFLVDQSDIETYELIQDESEIGSLHWLEMAGYNIKINQIFDKNPDKFSGAGTTQLWAGGPEVAFNFSDLKVKPYKYDAKYEANKWMAIDGEVNIKVGEIMANESWFDLETQADCDGTFQAKFNVLRLVAKVEGSMDSNNKFYKITKDNSFAEAKVIGKWSTNWYKPGTQDLYEFTSNETAIKTSFIDGFDGTLNLNPQDLDGLANGEIYVLFSAVGIEGKTDMKIKGFQAETDLSGAVLVSKSKPSSSNSSNFETLQIPFANQKNLNFPVTFQNSLDWSLVKDGSVRAKVSKAYIHLSDNGVLEAKFSEYPNGLNVDEFLLDFDVTSLNVGSLKPDVKKNGLMVGGFATQEHMSINLDKMNSKGFGFYSLGTSENEINTKTKLSGYDATLSNSKKSIVNNKINFMIIKGFLYVPFINDWSKLNIEIDQEKLKDFTVSFDYNKKYYLNNSTDNQIYITLSNGILKNGIVRISPNLHVENGKKGFETKNLFLCDVYVNPTGAISFNTNSFDSNTETVCEGNQKLASYYQFDYPIETIKLKQKSVKNDVEFVFSGNVILAENITTTSKKETGFIYHGKDPKPDSQMYIDLNSTQTLPNNGGMPKGIKPKGPSFSDENLEYSIENTIAMTDDGKEIQGSYEDGAQKFGGGFKYIHNDKWGDCFMLNGSYETKEPDYKKLEAKMILGKNVYNTGKFSYWFFKFEQIGVVTVPIIPAVVELYGFGGTTYYHMKVDYDNQTGEITNILPNVSKGLGIVATAYVQTAYDKGRTIHAKSIIVTQFKGWSIDGIDYYINGDAIAENNQSTGVFQARMHGHLNFIDKYIDGTGAIWGGIPNVICIGEENQDNLGFHFGADNFYIYVGTKDAPITADVFCGGKIGFSAGTWLTFSKSNFGFGISNKYGTGWIEADLFGLAGAAIGLEANLKSDITVNFNPFQVTGTGSFSGRGFGKAYIKYFGSVGGGMDFPSLGLSVSMPNPVVLKGGIECDVSDWIPNFTINAVWSSTNGFGISL